METRQFLLPLCARLFQKPLLLSSDFVGRQPRWWSFSAWGVGSLVGGREEGEGVGLEDGDGGGGGAGVADEARPADEEGRL